MQDSTVFLILSLSPASPAFPSPACEGRREGEGSSGRGSGGAFLRVLTSLAHSSHSHPSSHHAIEGTVCVWVCVLLSFMSDLPSPLLLQQQLLSPASHCLEPLQWSPDETPEKPVKENVARVSGVSVDTRDARECDPFAPGMRIPSSLYPLKRRPHKGKQNW